MSLWSRIINVFRGDRLSREIDEELQSHIEEAIEQGCDPAEARRALGSALRHREESHDIRLITWLDSLRADAVFGWRQIRKRKATSAAAILSLALAIGACTSAFRIIDALLLRPLPVAGAERLYVVAFQGAGGDRRTYDSCSYPMFRQMRTAVKDQAELMAVSYADRIDITYGSDQEMEKAYWQYVSGWMFSAFRLRPALGRLLSESDDLSPGAHPYAVLSYDYWTNRFGRDASVIGRTFRMGNDLFQIVGVAPEDFTGTETGAMTDIFVPMMMKNPRTLASTNNFWLRTLVLMKPGEAAGRVYGKLTATFKAIQVERAKGFTLLPQQLEEFFKEKLLLEYAPAGRSNLQRDYGQSLVALAVLVAMVLLIACANVANLMMAQAAARAREMALRVSIGAGRRRLVQLVLVESAMLAIMAAVGGAFFAWWAAPVVVSMINPPDNPARLILPADWRLFGFGLALTIMVMLLFGLAPALRASSINPSSALKGGEDPRERRRLMHALIAVQVAFCFLVLFVAGLFVGTFERLSHQFTGFSAQRILNLETLTLHPQPPVYWDQVSEHLRAIPGVEAVAMVGWPLMSGESWVGTIAVHGAPSPVQSDIIRISPGWFGTMSIPLIDGRDFNATDTYPPVAIVNQAFAKQFFDGEDPVGKSFEKVDVTSAETVRFQVVGYVRDARSRDDMRLAIRPTAYVPLHAIDAEGALQSISRGTFVVRTSSPNPLALAPTLRREVPGARSEFRVTNVRAQEEINQAHAVRERLLARLAIFFGVVALLLAGIGLYGVLDYSVVQRQREIAIRMAIGARAGEIARRVTVDVFSMVVIGALAGLGLGFGSVRFIGSLLFQVKPTDATMLMLPALTLVAAAFLAALPPVIRAVRTDPVTILRAE